MLLQIDHSQGIECLKIALVGPPYACDNLGMHGPLLAENYALCL